MSKRSERHTEPQYAQERRRRLRSTSTDPERLLWWAIRDRQVDGHKFRRQHSIGRYIVDFACLEQKLVIELDGDYHDQVIDKDLERQRFLEDSGYQVLRFSNDEVSADLEAIVIAVSRALKSGQTQ